MRPSETPGHSRVSLSQSLMGSGILSPGSWCTQVSVCALAESVSPVLCKFWRLYGGLMPTSSKSTYAIPRSTALRAPPPAAVHCGSITSQETPRHSSVSVSVGSLGPDAHKVCLSLLGSLVGVGFDYKPEKPCWGFFLALGHGCGKILLLLVLIRHLKV